MQSIQSIAESHGLTLHMIQHTTQGTGWRDTARRCVQAQLPPDVTVHRGVLGNPVLSDGGSVSMSYTRVVSGVLLGAAGRLIGLDIEQLDRKIRAVQRYCSEDELAWLDAYSNRQQGSMILWSFKEALVKALGTGLRLPSAAVAAAVAPQPNGVFVATFPMFPCLQGHAVMDNNLRCVMAIVLDQSV